MHLLVPLCPETSPQQMVKSWLDQLAKLDQLARLDQLVKSWLDRFPAAYPEKRLAQGMKKQHPRMYLLALQFPGMPPQEVPGWYRALIFFWALGHQAWFSPSKGRVTTQRNVLSLFTRMA